MKKESILIGIGRTRDLSEKQKEALAQFQMDQFPKEHTKVCSICGELMCTYDYKNKCLRNEITVCNLCKEKETECLNKS